MTGSIIFGTDGWRGLLDSEVNEHSVMLVAQALSDYLRERSASPSAAVGYDGRRNSRLFAERFAAVLAGNDIDVRLSDAVLPTPALSWCVKANGLHVGVMITASHNPPEYNGIKFKASYGGPFTTEETHLVESFIGRNPVRTAASPVPVTDMIAPYKAQLRSFIDLPLIGKAGLNVVADSMSGAGARCIEELLDGTGTRCTTIFGTPEPTFSGRLAEPIEKNLEPLRDALRAGTYSLGVATDGDADRLGVLLENGDWLSSQETILLLADYLKNVRKLPGDIIKTSSVTNLIDLHFSSPSCTVHDVQVGFKYICETMLRTDAAFGAEESGGYGFRGHIPERDGILSALLVMEMLAVSPFRTISAYLHDIRTRYGTVHYDRIDHPYHAPDRIERLPALENNAPETICGHAVTSTSSFYSSRGVVNGLKFRLEGDARWLLLRSSETEPLIRLYAEGSSEDDVRNILRAGMALIA